MKSQRNILFDSESTLMKVCTFLGLKKLRWSLRRLHCPVDKNSLVLEVGAGGNPYPRANVLLDAMESTIERNEQQLITDRPLVLGLCEELPFKDKSFDFVIASHVLEHTDNPEAFLNELMRVGKSGYIETPDGWFEKLCAFTYHRLEVSEENSSLIIKKKSSWKPDDISRAWDYKLSKSSEVRRLLRANPDLNTMRFYWDNQFHYKILNPEINASWDYPISEIKHKPQHNYLLFNMRNTYLRLRMFLFSQNRRNKQLNITSLLRCPTCHDEALEYNINTIGCIKCKSIYEVTNRIPKLFPKNIDGFNQKRLS